jgi:ribosomal-protein-serine acetyltransferase
MTETYRPKRLRLDEQTELRPLDPGCTDAYFAMIDRHRAHIAAWVRTPARLADREAARLHLESFAESNQAGQGVSMGLWHKDALVGEVALYAINWRERSSFIGYYLAEDAQGKGLVTRACGALLGLAFDTLKLNRVELSAAVGNARSRAVAERLGFAFEGVQREAQRFDDRYEDLATYALLARDWRER